VHRKKDATDWGVEPQIHVPMDEETEHEIMELHSRQEAIRSASTKPSLHAATEPVDGQLQQAINILISDSLLHGVPATTEPVATTQR
jgi:hypothetical protein